MNRKGQIIPVNLSAAPLSKLQIKEVVFTEHSYSGIDLPRGVQIGLGHSNGDVRKDALKSWQDAAEKYNKSIQAIFAIDGFEAFFLSKGGVVTRKEVFDQFGREAEKTIWSMYCLHGTQFGCTSDAFIMSDSKITASFDVDGMHFSYNLDDVLSQPYYQDQIAYFFDWSERDVNFGDALYYQFCQDLEAVPYFFSDLGMDECLNNDELHPCFKVALHLMKNLEERHYLKQYTLTPASEDMLGIWSYYTRRIDNTVGFAILDLKYKKDKLLVERIRCLLKCLETVDNDENIIADNPLAPEGGVDSYYSLDLDSPFYFLQDQENHTYISRTKAQNGGHYGLKIYGRLNCPSAAKFLAKGQYVKNRVFFADEKTAVAAGYRPCGVCMKAAYRKWKEDPESFMHQYD